jgi:DNA-binding NarL/FixJ family response regulator
MSIAVASTVRVLVVDDQPAFLDAARAVVERAPGFSVVATATDGVEALQLIDEARPDLVLMDVQMPGLDGVETARRLLDADGRSVIVLMSSYEQGDLPGGPAAARVAFIAKEDLSPDTLVDAWRRGSDATGHEIPT